MFRDTVGLRPDSKLERIKSIFPEEGKKIFYLSDVTTSYNEMKNNPVMKDKLISRIRQIVNSFKGNIALFFPSYKLLNSILEELNLSKPVNREYLGMEQEELMKTVTSFKSESNSVLAGVIGGRLAEGVDFPDKQLEMAVIVGIPYPSPDVRQKALQNYYDKL